MKALKLISPKNLAQQMILVLLITQFLLLILFFAADYLSQDDLIETATSAKTTNKLASLLPLIDSYSVAQIDVFHKNYSRCFEGYRISQSPFKGASYNDETRQAANEIARRLNISNQRVLLGITTLKAEHFSFTECGANMAFPIKGAVINIQLSQGAWLQAEVHTHQWHFHDLHSWIISISILFMISTMFGAFLINHLTKPLNELSDTSRKFAEGIHYTPVNIGGSPDIRQTIQSFNEMQRKVADEMSRQTDTLAALSHDVRTPLTSLRIKAELVDDREAREGLISSIDKIERITTMALDYLKGDSAKEERRKVDLNSLVSSECEDFNLQGFKVRMNSNTTAACFCRPIAFTRALRNLIENAVKQGSEVVVTLSDSEEQHTVSVADNGQGVPRELWAEIVKPFFRGTEARTTDSGGFGLGLAIVNRIIEGMNGKLSFSENKPTGFIVTIRLPK